VPDELEIIADLARRFAPVLPVVTGIGDDGAVLDCQTASRIVVVTDMLLDGVHFDVRTTPVELIGRKSIAVNLSDLAAMACQPTAAFVSIAVPSGQTDRDVNQFIRRLYDGIDEICRQFSCSIAGGDTNSWSGPFAINVCLTGTPMRDEAILRSGGSAGDQLFVTGPLGGSLGNERHLKFTPRLKIAGWLAQNCPPTAMMDVSDGLAIDLKRLADQSGVGALVDESRIPIHADVPSQLPDEKRIAAAVADGEDFELLFAVRPEHVAVLTSASAVDGLLFHHIGELQAAPGCRLERADGHVSELPEVGWKHRF
jgi:thiamine-monophosphate kinase